MAIPNAREPPPPPLPPPRNIGDLNNGNDPGWQWGNSFNGFEGKSVKPGSSLLGNYLSKEEDVGGIGERPDYVLARRAHSIAAIGGLSVDIKRGGIDLGDEDRNSLPRPDGCKYAANYDLYRLQSERQLGQRSVANSSQAYDKQLLSKIGNPLIPTRTTGSSFLSPSSQDSPVNAPNALGKLNSLKPLSVPERRTLSPARSGFRSPILEHTPIETSSRRFGSFSAASGYDETTSTASHRGSVDHGVFMDQDFIVEEHGMRELNLNDRSPSVSDEYQLVTKGGLKRQASSPPMEASREDRASASATGGNDLYHRRSAQMLVNRNSPASRFNKPSSVSSASSFGQRTSSYASSFGLSVASSATSYSGEKLSPSALSPSAESDFGPGSPYAANTSLNPSPRASVSHSLHQRVVSENNEPSSQPRNRKMSTDSITYPRKKSVSGIEGLHICECCPKKPKKFNTEDELRIHELEKQYTCSYCPNRFKNKNEAERHQNSLHLRRHSWSCAALAGVTAAFHTSSTHGTTDVCGYCGEDFPNPPNWEARAEHLNHVHKFGECNQAKKFFRADHFRQHLKHSHAGTSGKWTNMLENACMKDEPALKERLSSVSSLSGGTPASVGVGIDTVHEES
ncbi:hypothetical protein M501DRAFT_930299 [Patellaria atrata CBS 101060]|uniref:C2H2-type domain-containing protein n=1 Tax=Patellaria atrata CBS 101060 TaxID=1346257 RepID=A0A9P4SDI7_9PEZI|nr:hypothetical protein M501DRAFT_930299 [Patellaria atrata CBS 101060]